MIALFTGCIWPENISVCIWMTKWYARNCIIDIKYILLLPVSMKFKARRASESISTFWPEMFANETRLFQIQKKNEMFLPRGVFS